MDTFVLNLYHRMAWMMARHPVMVRVAYLLWLVAMVYAVAYFADSGRLFLVASILTVFIVWEMTNAYRLVAMIASYLMVCNYAQFSRRRVERAIHLLHQPAVARVLSRLYGPQQVVEDLIIAEGNLFGRKAAMEAA